MPRLILGERVKRIIKDFLRQLLFGVACLLPKKERAVLRGFPSYEDNLIAIYQGLLSRPLNSIIWIVDDPALLPPLDLAKKVRLVRRGGLLDIYFSITSRFLFLTHGHFFDSPPRNQISVNLWHGIPFKTIGKGLGKKGRDDSFVVATSPLTRRVFAGAFGVPESKVVITGQARTDRMLAANSDKIWERCFPGVAKPSLIFLWLPTYRRTNYLPGQNDGAEFSNIYNCSDFSEEEFNAYLKSQNSFCVVKPHPMARKSSYATHSNIIHVDEAWLFEHRVSLYELTGAADCLISDISSIIADFMLLDRPIVLLFEDIEEYAGSRGFSFAPILEYLPAEVTVDFRGFMQKIMTVHNGADPDKIKRAKLRDQFFRFDDANSTARILDQAFGLAS